MTHIYWWKNYILCKNFSLHIHKELTEWLVFRAFHLPLPNHILKYYFCTNKIYISHTKNNSNYQGILLVYFAIFT